MAMDPSELKQIADMLSGVFMARLKESEAGFAVRLEAGMQAMREEFQTVVLDTTAFKQTNTDKAIEALNAKFDERLASLNEKFTTDLAQHTDVCTRMTTVASEEALRAVQQSAERMDGRISEVDTDVSERIAAVSDKTAELVESVRKAIPTIPEIPQQIVYVSDGELTSGGEALARALNASLVQPAMHAVLHPVQEQLSAIEKAVDGTATSTAIAHEKAEAVVVELRTQMDALYAQLSEDAKSYAPVFAVDNLRSGLDRLASGLDVLDKRTVAEARTLDTAVERLDGKIEAATEATLAVGYKAANDLKAAVDEASNRLNDEVLQIKKDVSVTAEAFDVATKSLDSKIEVVATVATAGHDKLADELKSATAELTSTLTTTMQRLDHSISVTATETRDAAAAALQDRSTVILASVAESIAVVTVELEKARAASSDKLDDVRKTVTAVDQSITAAVQQLGHSISVTATQTQEAAAAALQDRSTVILASVAESIAVVTVELEKARAAGSDKLDDVRKSVIALDQNTIAADRSVREALDLVVQHVSITEQKFTTALEAERVAAAAAIEAVSAKLDDKLDDVRKTVAAVDTGLVKSHDALVQRIASAEAKAATELEEHRVVAAVALELADAKLYDKIADDFGMVIGGVKTSIAESSSSIVNLREAVFTTDTRIAELTGAVVKDHDEYEDNTSRLTGDIEVLHTAITQNVDAVRQYLLGELSSTTERILKLFGDVDARLDSQFAAHKSLNSEFADTKTGVAIEFNRVTASLLPEMRTWISTLLKEESGARLAALVEHKTALEDSLAGVSIKIEAARTAIILEAEARMRSIAGALEETVGAHVDTAVNHAVPAAVAGAVEPAVTAAVAAAVPGAVGAAVAPALADALPGAVGAAVGAAIPLAVADAVPLAVANAMPAVAAGLSADLAKGLNGISAQILEHADRIQKQIAGTVQPAVDTAVAAAVQPAVDAAVPGIVAASLEEVYTARVAPVIAELGTAIKFIPESITSTVESHGEGWLKSAASAVEPIVRQKLEHSLDARLAAQDSAIPAQVTAAVQARVEDLEPKLMVNLAAKLQAAFDRLPAPPPGKDGLNARVVPPLPYELGKHYEHSAWVVHKNGVWVAARHTDEEPDASSTCWDCVVPGVQKMEPVLEEDGRTLSFYTRLANGEETKQQIILKVPVTRDTYRHGSVYAEKDWVQHDGGIWEARKSGALERPGLDGSWKLLVKKGQDGKNARPGPAAAWKDCGEWLPDTEYLPGDIVEHAGVGWLAMKSNRQRPPFTTLMSNEVWRKLGS